MNVYLDASVVLGRLRREAKPIPDWTQWDHAYASVLLRVEVLRTVDRMRLSGALADRQVADMIANAQAVFDAIDFVALSPQILHRAEQSFRTTLGTLDALHLSTALLLVERVGIELEFFTHDEELAVAARSANFTVVGA